ncbi:hypothetical protein ACWDA7_27995 [Streptomyces sp. NPDC001156]
MGTGKDWAYRVEQPHGSEGWRPYNGLERWQGTIATEKPCEDAQHVAALVVADLVREWRRNHADVMHVRILVWADEELARALPRTSLSVPVFLVCAGQKA